MKILNLICILSFFSSPLLMSQANHDSKGHILTIVKNKIMQDSKEIGFITKDSLIQNSKGQKIGFLKNDGTLVDEQGNLIGRPGKNAITYYHYEGTTGFVLKETPNGDCMVSDSTGKEIAMIPKVSSKMACAMICCMASLEKSPNENYKHPGQVYTCPMHPDQTGHKGDKCKKCGMSMVK